MKIIDMMRADSPLPGHSAEWHFYRSYVGTALWSSHDDDDHMLDANYDISDLSDDTREKMLRNCASFYARNRWHIHCEDAPLSREFEGSIAAREASMAGHDFWLNHNGHGAGFWDGDWPEPAATVLDKAARKYRELDLFVIDSPDCVVAIGHI